MATIPESAYQDNSAMAAKLASFDEFYAAIGRATTAWFNLEEALRDVFSRLIVCTIHGTMLDLDFAQQSVLSTVFYSSTNLRGKLAMLSELISELIDDPDILAEWNAAENKTNELYKKRNILAHGAVWGNKEAGASEIGPPIFAKRRKSLTYEQVCQADHSFQAMAERLTKIAIAINRHLVTRRAVKSG